MKYIQLADDYGINSASHGDKTVGQAFPDYKTKFKSYYERLTKYEGWTDAQFQGINVLPAAFMDKMWQRCAFGVGGAQLISVINIQLPSGKWSCNIDCVLPYGSVEGNGTFVSYPTNDSTQIVMNSKAWLGKLKDKDNKPLRTLFISPTYGQEAFVASYHESGTLSYVRLTGDAPAWLDTTYSAYGVYTADAGETHGLQHIYTEGFNTAGFAFERGTPAFAKALTAFNCNYTGIHLIGTALNTLELSASVDDCPSMFHMDAGRGREAGGVVVFTINKKETGVTSEDRGPWKGTIVGYCQGQFSVTCLGVSNAAASVKVNTMFFVNPKLLNGTPQRCSIFVAASKGFNCQSFVQDSVNHKEWPAIPDYSGACLYYTSHYGGRCIVDMTEVMASNPSPTNERLGFFKGGGTFNYATGTPTYSYTGGVTPPPVIPPPVNPPVDPPVNPPSTTVKWAKTYTTPTTTSTKVAVPAGVNPINETRLVNVKISGAGFTYINSHLFWGQGGTLWRMTATGWVDTGIKVVVGQALNVSVPMAGTTLTNVIGGAGATCVFTGKVELY